MESAGYRCPLCGGLLEAQHIERATPRAACLRGHEFSADELLTIFALILERGGEFEWSATVQVLTEYAELARRLARMARQRARGDVATAAAEELERRAREAEMRAWRLRRDQQGPMGA